LLIQYYRHFNCILNAMLSLYSEFVKLPLASQVLSQIKYNLKLYPYFKNCIGAIDSTHILAKVLDSQVIPYRNRKGDISQNVLAACKFNLQFIYLLPGWNGSAHDARVLQHALENDFIVPKNKNYLADAGYGLRKGFLTTYRGVQYHLCEQANAAPKLTLLYHFFVK
jgi:hypothetical protein